MYKCSVGPKIAMHMTNQCFKVEFKVMTICDNFATIF